MLRGQLCELGITRRRSGRSVILLTMARRKANVGIRSRPSITVAVFLRRGSAMYRTALAAVCIILCGLPSVAQTFTGGVTGRIYDPSQAAVPNASVVLNSVDTAAQRTTTSSGEGVYNFGLLAPGRYRLEAWASGFDAAEVEVEISVAVTTRADIFLNLKKVQQTATVFGANGVAVQTENAELGMIVNRREITDLPSETRNPYDFIALSPGANLSNDGGGVGFAVNGQRSTSGNYMLDGAENNNPFAARPGQNVPLDSIEEYRLQSNNYTAEFGRNSGFVANVLTKSGSNEFHGSLYDYVRNSAFAANSYDGKAHGLSRPVFNRHQFGGTFGGPIQKKKLFFFGSIEPVLVRSNAPQPFFVPTSQLISLSSPGVQALFDRYPIPPNVSTTNVLMRLVCPFGSTCDIGTGSGFVNLPAFAFTSRNGPLDVGAGPPQNSYLASARLDWLLNSSTQVIGHYALQRTRTFALVSQPYSATLDEPSHDGGQNVAASLIHTWNPRWISESRLVYQRITFGQRPSPSVSPFPLFYFLHEPVTLPSYGDVDSEAQNIYQLAHTTTWAHGKHIIKFGGQYIHIRDNRVHGIAPDGFFSDVQGFVDGVLDLYEIALDPKDHLPGEQVEPPFGPPAFGRHFHYNEPALFVEDTWKPRPRLTVSSGLRWEHFDVQHSPGSEHVLDSNFYLGNGASLPVRIANGTFMRTVDAAGDLRGHFYRPEYANFAPRLGLAYDLFGDGTTVLRSGVGIFNDRKFGDPAFNVLFNPPTFSLMQLSGVNMTSDLLSNVYSVFPNSPIVLSGAAARMLDSDLKTPYTISWNATVERDVKRSMVAAASYVGASGVHLYSLSNINRIGSGGLRDPSCVGVRTDAAGNAIGPDYTGCTRLNLLAGDINERSSQSHSSYHALQLRLDTRFLARLGVLVGANYTWSHSIDNKSSVGGADGTANAYGPPFLDAFNPRLDKGSSDFDQTHRFAAHFIWDIPLARGMVGVRRLLLGGWETSGILTFQTGQPFSIFDSGVPDHFFEMTRPRLTGRPPSPGKLVRDANNPDWFLYMPLNQVYDPTSGLCLPDAKPLACEISVNGPFAGNMGRNTYRRPGLQYHNVAIMKTFTLAAETHLQFRAEFYNLFNHPNLIVAGGTNDVNTAIFSTASGTSSGVIAGFFDTSRQIVLAMRLTF
jgi:Carboxypeptidase regulatory-like domain/TonB dependent receptor